MGRRTALLALVGLLVFATVGLGQDVDEEREFRRRVDKAITKGCEYLASVQSRDGTWSSPYDDKYPGGATALCLLALLVSEYNVWSETVEKAMEHVLSTDFDRTYSAAIAMMAVEARHIPPEEWRAMREGRPIKRFVRKLGPRARAFLEKHVQMLLAGRLHEAWGYPKGPDFTSDWGGDLSNTQYGILGLKSAARCGVRIDENVWLRLLRIVLNAQEKDGPRVRLVISRTPDRKGHTSVATRVARVRGWGYRWPYTIKSGKTTQTMNPGPDDKPSGSMTTAGISCLAIIHSELLKSRRYRNKIRTVSEAIHDGFAWLDAHWAVDTNPGGNRGWHYYYIYGLERAGVLADRKWIGEHDWYREGAEFLLGRQSGVGSWNGGILDTAFALLFLKRSTTPVATTGLNK